MMLSRALFLTLFWLHVDGFPVAGFLATCGTTRIALHLVNTTMMPTEQRIVVNRQIAFMSGIAFGNLLDQ
jgi:hypothetical protein